MMLQSFEPALSLSVISCLGKNMRPITVFFVSVTMDSNLTAGVLSLPCPYDAFVFHLLKIIGLITVFSTAW
jgi:hypothetical protein